MWGLPYHLAGPIAKPDTKDSMVTYIMDKEDNMVSYMSVQQDWPEIGQTFPPTIPISTSNHSMSNPHSSCNIPQPRESNESHTAKTEPTPTQPTLHPTNPDKVLLTDLVFCGLHQPCPCLPKLSQQQASLLPPHYPIYLPQHHQPCAPYCGCHHVHRSGACHCVPPNINQYLDPPDWFWEMFPQSELSFVIDFICWNRLVC